MSNSKKHTDIQIAQKIATLMDSQFEIPGIGIKIGLDPIIGLIPGVGDFISNAIGVYPIRMAIRNELPRPIIIQMVLNLALDYFIGSIPILGDAFDIIYKAHQRNLSLLIKGIEGPKSQKRLSVLFIALVSLVLLVILMAPIFLIIAIVNNLG